MSVTCFHKFPLPCKIINFPSFIIMGIIAVSSGGVRTPPKEFCTPMKKSKYGQFNSTDYSILKPQNCYFFLLNHNVYKILPLAVGYCRMTTVSARHRHPPENVAPL